MNVLNLKPVDRHDPEAAATAVHVSFPDTLSGKAMRGLSYFEDTAFLFLYKGQLVVTDESLYLTDHGDGSRENPFGFPRFVCSTCDELNAWLEAVADGLDEGVIW